MSHELRNKLDKQDHVIELLEEELRATNLALEEKSEFAAALESDLENVIQQLQQYSVSRSISVARSF